jgi:hypothetical protein
MVGERQADRGHPVPGRAVSLILEQFENGLYDRGVLYPSSTFTFLWSERRRPRAGR